MLTRILFFFISSVYLVAQTSIDQVAFQQAMSAPSDSARLAAFDRFIVENPNSKLIPNAYIMKFQAYSNLKNDSAAFASAQKYLGAIDQSQIVPVLNAVAYEFAQRKFFLDSAVVFIDRAIDQYKKEEPVLLNTKAFVLYQLQRYREAEKIQQKAIGLLPPHSEYDSRYAPFSIQLGFIQVELNNSFEGLKKIMLGSLVVPKQSISVHSIDSLIEYKKISLGRVNIVRDSLFSEVIIEHLKNSRDTIMAKSMLAVSLSRNNVLSEKALSFAKETYASVQTRSIEDRSGAAAALGLTYYHLKQYDESEKFLSEAAKFASPNETEIFVSLGDAKEKLGKKQEAFDMYITAIFGSRSTAIYNKLLELKNELFPALLLDSIITARQTIALQFTPEEFHRNHGKLKQNEYPKVVMAELFTGSECKPCQAADVAFDYLIERFKTSSLAILEYHLHIPQPDPFVNEDSENRGEYYNVNSTPTAIFDGTVIVPSGGNKLAAKSKFLLYSEVIERQLETPSSVEILLTSKLKKNSLTIKAEAFAISKNNKLKLRIAIVEDEVFYKGSNGIEQHKFVVRKMVKSADGFSFPKKGKLVVNEAVNIKTLIADLGKYYETTNARYAQLGSGLKAKKNDIDMKRLAVVAFVQDDMTREILQASVVKVD